MKGIIWADVARWSAENGIDRFALSSLTLNYWGAKGAELDGNEVGRGTDVERFVVGGPCAAKSVCFKIKCVSLSSLSINSILYFFLLTRSVLESRPS